ncbi:hypothetical protein FQN51_007975 [Onygenales sp. PD_10]|nr:hypothetical protein FQN51_007975 [Onygenales sp. PD_10]
MAQLSQCNVNDPWAEAFSRLSPKDRAQFGGSGLGMLETLENIHVATKDCKELCIKKGWRAYRNKNGEEVKLRHVLEKTSVWVTEMIKVADKVVSFDNTGLAALPWGAIKFIITFAVNDVNLFRHVVEGVESISGLIARYTIVEMLYLHEDFEATPLLRECITKLYTAILGYLAHAQTYFSDSTLNRIGRGVMDTLSKKYDELWAEISEIEIEKCLSLVDAEFQRKMAKYACDRHEELMNSLHRLARPIIDFTDSISALTDNLNSQERRKLLRWMSEIEYWSHHDELSKDLLSGSGQWLLQSKEYIEWGQSSVPSVFWLQGKPGSGKTRLVSRLVSSIIENDMNSNTYSIAFFYCARDSAEPARANPSEILRALLRQLASSKLEQPIKSQVTKEYETRRAKVANDSKIGILSIDECTSLILDVIGDKEVIIVVDALDECEDSSELLIRLDKILNESRGLVKIFVSSRETVNVVSLSALVVTNIFSTFTCILLTSLTTKQLYINSSRITGRNANGNDVDIDRFIDSEIERLSSQKLLLGGPMGPKLRTKTAQMLKEGAQGMFKWVALSLEALRKINHPRDFERALGRLPRKLSGLYDTIFEQIYAAEVFEQRTAVMTFKWLMCAQRLLSSEELIAAVSGGLEDRAELHPESESALTDEETWISEGFSVSDTDIVQYCRNLVVVDSDLGVFRLAHQSVREYLEQKIGYSPSNTHLFALEQCIELHMIGMAPMAKLSWLDKQVDMFKSYATVYWPLHLQKVLRITPSIETLPERVTYFLLHYEGDDSPFNQWMTSAKKERVPFSNLMWMLDESFCEPVTPFFLACSFGLDWLLKGVMRRPDFRYDIKNARRRIGLDIAIKRQNMGIVELLLPRTDVKFLERHGPMLLSAAARLGDMKMGKLLLSHPWSHHGRHIFYREALRWAIENDDINVAKEILSHSDHGINAQMHYGQMPLHEAAMYGRVQIAKLLIAHPDVNINSQDSEGETPILKASFGYHEKRDVIHPRPMDRIAYEEFIDLLMAHPDIDINKPCHRHSTLLIVEIRFGTKERVERILSHPGIDLTIEEHRTENLLRSTRFSSENIFHMLVSRLNVDTGIDLAFWDEMLWSVARHGRRSAAKWLLSRPRINVNVEQTVEWRPIFCLARYREFGVEYPPRWPKRDPQSPTSGSFTPIFAAVMGGHSEVVELLLRQPGINVNPAESMGLTPLNLAMTDKQTEIVNIFLAQPSVNFNITTISGETPLLWAANQGNKKMIEQLLARPDVDVNLAGCKEHEGTLLCWAVRHEDEAVFKMLLAHRNIDINTRNPGGCTALSWAIKKAHMRMVKTLLARPEIDVNVKDMDEESPLSLAAALSPKTEILELLLSHSKVDVNAELHDGRTLFFLAAETGNMPVLKQLSKHPDIDPNAADRHLMSPLMAAAQNWDQEIVEFLLAQKGVEVSGKKDMRNELLHHTDNVVVDLLSPPDVMV